MKIKYIRNGVEVTEDEFRSTRQPIRSIPMATKAYDSGSPLQSMSCSVHPDQAREHHEFCRERGITGVDISAEGDVSFRTRRSRRDYLKARGLVDRDGGYSD